MYKPTLDQLAHDAGTTVQEAGKEKMQALIDEWFARENAKLDEEQRIHFMIAMVIVGGFVLVFLAIIVAVYYAGGV